MTTKQMNDLVDRYLDSNGLSNPSIRKRAARKVLGYMDTTGAFLSGGQLALPSDKGVVVSAYKRHKGSALNGAEKVSSIISMNWPDLQLANLLPAMP